MIVFFFLFFIFFFFLVINISSSRNCPISSYFPYIWGSYKYNKQISLHSLSKAGLMARQWARSWFAVIEDLCLQLYSELN